MIIRITIYFFFVFSPSSTMTYLPIFDSPQPTKRQKSNVNMSLDGYMFNKELRFVRKIGAGTYGLIYLVENIYTKQQFAAKMVLKQQPMKLGSSSNKQLIQQQFSQYFHNHVIPKPTSIDFDYIKGQGHDCQFLTEIALHLKVHDHPNIATIHEVFELEGFAIVILLDYYDQGDLFTNIIDLQIFQQRRSDKQKQLLMKNAMLQLCAAVEYCHQKSVYHCDLKPENIMVKYNKEYKRRDSGVIDYDEIQLVLIDFGLAIDSSFIKCNACRGSSFYMAPERVTNYKSSKLIRGLVDINQFPTDAGEMYLPTLAGDIWSLGVLFINITCSRNPWPIAAFNENSEVFTNYILNRNKSILTSILPISNQFNDLLNSIFKLNPNERVTLKKLQQQIITCDFFNDHQYNNPQLITPDATAYNSYASDYEEEEEDDYEDIEDEEEYFTDAEDIVQVEDMNNVISQQLTPPQDFPEKQHKCCLQDFLLRAVY